MISQTSNDNSSSVQLKEEFYKLLKYKYFIDTYSDISIYYYIPTYIESLSCKMNLNAIFLCHSTVLSI